MAIITYNSNVVKEIKPTIVEVSIMAFGEGKTAKEAIDAIIKQRKIIKEFILSKNSYKKDSYKQTKIDLIKKNHKVYKYYLKDPEYNLKTCIDSEEYNKLSSMLKTKYYSVENTEFDKYVANISIYAILNNNDTVINDFVDIFNLATSLDFKCVYNHNVLSTEKTEIDMNLYAECINNGMQYIRGVIGNTELSFRDIKLLEISDTNSNYSFSNNVLKSSCYKEENTYYNTEQIVIPELIEDLFNNNIEFSKTLSMKIEIL